MGKKMENMTREEILKEFEGGEVVYRVPRRPKKLVPLTLRVHPDLIKQLGTQAKKKGIAGHTTMARLLLEQAVTKPPHNMADEIADAVARKLRKRIA